MPRPFRPPPPIAHCPVSRQCPPEAASAGAVPKHSRQRRSHDRTAQHSSARRSTSAGRRQFPPEETWAWRGRRAWDFFSEPPRWRPPHRGTPAKGQRTPAHAPDPSPTVSPAVSPASSAPAHAPPDDVCSLSLSPDASDATVPSPAASSPCGASESPVRGPGMCGIPGAQPWRQCTPPRPVAPVRRRSACDDYDAEVWQQSTPQRTPQPAPQRVVLTPDDLLSSPLKRKRDALREQGEGVTDAVLMERQARRPADEEPPAPRRRTQSMPHGRSGARATALEPQLQEALEQRAVADLVVAMERLGGTVVPVQGPEAQQRSEAEARGSGLLGPGRGPPRPDWARLCRMDSMGVSEAADCRQVCSGLCGCA